MRLVAPFLLAVAVPVVFVGTIIVVATIDNTVGLHRLVRVGDIDAVVAVVLIGSPVFLGMTRLLNRHEPSVVAVRRTHFRHCAFLYIGALVGAALLVVYREFSNGLAYGYVAVLFLVTVYGIVMNAVALTAWQCPRTE